MEICKSIDSLRAVIKEAGLPIGLVPTMGSLHDGHISLVRRARSENKTVVTSIFINPLQFESTDDLNLYPRSLENDLDILREECVDVAFTPPTTEMYPRGFDTTVRLSLASRILEGQFRNGHFDGVSTVVCKLLSLTRADRAYFGQKDAQQSVIINKMNSDLNLGAEIIMMPTVREKDGLATSSRNVHLSPAERKAATILYKSLSLAESMGAKDAQTIKKNMRTMIETEPLARLEYISISDAFTLEEVDLIEKPTLISLAIWIGKTRLIDNTTLK